MSSCLVKGCKSSWRRKDSSVSLHTFPKDVNRVRLWLQQIGQFNDNLEEMVLKVWMGTVNDIYRLCSLHFTPDCYNYFENRRTLRKDAIPTLFGIEQPLSVGNLGQIENSNMSNTDGSLSASVKLETVSTSTTSVATCKNDSSKTNFILHSSAYHNSSTSDNCLNYCRNEPLCADPYGTPCPDSSDTLTNSPELDDNADYSSLICGSCGQRTIIVEHSTNQQKTQKSQPVSLPNTDEHPVTTRDFATNTVCLDNQKSKKIQVHIPTKNKKISCCTLRLPKLQAHHSMVVTYKNRKPSTQKNRLGLMQRVGSNLSRRWSRPYSSWKAVCKRRSNSFSQCPPAKQVNERIGSSQLARQDTSPNQERSTEYDPCSMAQKQPVCTDHGSISNFQNACENFIVKKHSTFGPSTSATTPADGCPSEHSVEVSCSLNSPESSDSMDQDPNDPTFHPND